MPRPAHICGIANAGSHGRDSSFMPTTATTRQLRAISEMPASDSTRFGWVTKGDYHHGDQEGRIAAVRARTGRDVHRIGPARPAQPGERSRARELRARDVRTRRAL